MARRRQGGADGRGGLSEDYCEHSEGHRDDCDENGEFAKFGWKGASENFGPLTSLAALPTAGASDNGSASGGRGETGGASSGSGRNSRGRTSWRVFLAPGLTTLHVNIRRAFATASLSG